MWRRQNAGSDEAETGVGVVSTLVNAVSLHGVGSDVVVSSLSYAGERTVSRCIALELLSREECSPCNAAKLGSPELRDDGNHLGSRSGRPPRAGSVHARSFASVRKARSLQRQPAAQQIPRV